ncbi:hypothetical protein [Nocardia sp. NBC_01327]|uniref:hypothetical protein n=1 Tax=Nocardia sp. NBC_01327 TaxID=2903593 RepID=UPI002E12DDA8|nr:hypothetical protein OG326_21790 [Nocardia sp. NBC_01327]
MSTPADDSAPAPISPPRWTARGEVGGAHHADTGGVEGGQTDPPIAVLHGVRFEPFGAWFTAA